MDHEKPEALRPHIVQQSGTSSVHPDVESPYRNGFGESTPPEDRLERRGDSLWYKAYLNATRQHSMEVVAHVLLFRRTLNERQINVSRSRCRMSMGERKPGRTGSALADFGGIWRYR